MGGARWVTVLLVVAMMFALPTGTAQDPWVYMGGEPGVIVTVGGNDIMLAADAGSAIPVDPSEPVNISISIAPPANTTWRVRAVTVGLLVSGPNSTPPDALLRQNAADADLPPGFTVVLNRTIDLGALERAGAGTFLMQVEVLDENETALYSQEFYLRVSASFAALLTVQGATITAVSVATGYGFWQLAKDGKEMRDAWERHRKKKERAKLDVIGAAEHVVEEVGVKVGHGVDKAVALHRAVQESEKQLGLFRWGATGLGLGGVAMAWLQFLGYLAFDGTQFFITALEGGAIFLTLALVANALLRRTRNAAPRTPAAPADTPPDEAEGRIAPSDPETRAPQADVPEARLALVEAPEPAPSAPVQPADKRR
jgi:hypothetical protein